MFEGGLEALHLTEGLARSIISAMRSPRPSFRSLAAVAFGLPFVLYLSTASGHGYWLDGGEFVAASVELGIAHPPGHPLAALLGAVATFLPFGPLSFRVALMSAFFAALASLFLFRAIDMTLRSMLPWAGIRETIALGATLSVAAASGWWFQAVRPEVYALQAALVCFILERVLAFEVQWPLAQPSRLYAASIAFGLALANHHLLAFLVLPAVAPSLAHLVISRALRPLWFCVLGTLAGLSTYLYLPLRAHAEPRLNLGDPDSLSRFFWVISAKAFQKNQGEGAPQPLGERFADVLVQLVLGLHPLLVLLALGGLYVLLRRRPTRRIAMIWGTTLVVFVAARAWLGFVRSNPDALGYLMPAMAALGALAASFVAALALLLVHEKSFRPTKRMWALALLALVLGVLQIGRSVGQASLARFADVDAFDDALRRDLPPRSVVLVHQAQTLFRLYGGQAEEELRPDLIVIPMPLLGYPGMAETIAVASPETRELLASLRLDGELRAPPLQTLAGTRPLLVEMDVRVAPELYDTLVPQGLYHQVLADGATDVDEREGAEGQQALWSRLDRELEGTRDPETLNQRIWRRYTDALYYAGFGDREAAQSSLAAARALNPSDRLLEAFEAALLASEETGPFDVGPYLLGAAVDAPTSLGGGS